MKVDILCTDCTTLKPVEYFPMLARLREGNFARVELEIEAIGRASNHIIPGVILSSLNTK